MGTPIRSCVVCRRSRPKDCLVRLVSTGAEIVVDPEAHRPGRGAYLCTREACLDSALRRGAAPLVRALRVRDRNVTVETEELQAAWAQARGDTEFRWRSQPSLEKCPQGSDA